MPYFDAGETRNDAPRTQSPGSCWSPRYSCWSQFSCHWWQHQKQTKKVSSFFYLLVSLLEVRRECNRRKWKNEQGSGTADNSPVSLRLVHAVSQVSRWSWDGGPMARNGASQSNGLEDPPRLRRGPILRAVYDSGFWLIFHCHLLPAPHPSGNRTFPNNFIPRPSWWKGALFLEEMLL